MDGSVRYYGGWAWNMRQVNDPDFDDLGTAAFLPEDSDGMGFAGLQWKINNDLMLQGSYHLVQNLADLAWVDLDYVWRLGDNRYLRFDTQVIYQGSKRDLPPTSPQLGGTSSGDVATTSSGTNSDLKTWHWAGYMEGRWWPWLIGYGMVGITADDDEIRSPYSLGPSYLVQRIGENAKAGEKTWIAGVTLDFGPLGAPGLSFDVNYGQRTDRHMQNAESRPLADWDELATDLIYVFPESAGWAKNIRLRARWAKVWEKGDQWSNGSIVAVDQTTRDLRFDFQWLVPFK
jgi:hypothetical protein